MEKKRNDIKDFILKNSFDKTFSEQALQYFSKVISCYMRCVSERVSLIATHSRRVTVKPKDFELFYVVTSADCKNKYLSDLPFDEDDLLSKRTIRYYTHEFIKRYNPEVYKLFSAIIKDFIVQVISRCQTHMIKTETLQKIMKTFHLYNFVKPVCEKSRVKVK